MSFVHNMETLVLLFSYNSWKHCDTLMLIDVIVLHIDAEKWNETLCLDTVCITAVFP